jgi:GAF domain-containing protein
MRRRSGAGGEPVKARRPKAMTLKGGNTPKDVRRRNSSDATHETEIARVIRERDEALEQRTATSEVLSIIRRSPADAQPVFDAIVQSAARLCGAIFSAVYLYEDDHVHIAATNNFSPEAARRAVELREQKRPDRSHLGGRAILDRAIVHVPDVLNDPEYSREWALAGGWRAVLAVPLLRDGKPVGAVTVAKAEPKPFSDRQVQLLNSFADQALIAIENVRLFEAEQQRTRELTEALEQQTATSEVLQVISSSPGDLQPVFAAMLAKAVRICDAKFGILYLREGSGFRLAAAHDVPPAYAKARGAGAIPPVPGGILESIMKTGRTMHLPDLAAMQSYAEGHPLAVAAVEVAGMRSLFGAPMLRENQLIGVIAIYRQEVQPFTDKQIELVQNFAAQAVIAIENTRLLNELRQRTDELARSVGELRALGEVSQSGELDARPRNGAHHHRQPGGTALRYRRGRDLCVRR